MKKSILKTSFSTLLMCLVFLFTNCGNKGTNRSIEASKDMQSQMDTGGSFFKIDNPKPNEKVNGQITVKGRHDFPTNTNVWILLHDGFGYYLQNPAVTLFEGGTWKQSNSIANGGIKSIMAVSVGSAGHKRFEEMVKEKKFGQFTDLPNDIKQLDEVEVTN